MNPTAYPPQIEILPLEKPVDATIAVPGSKSLTNRALILAALADGDTVLTGALASEDTVVMLDSLRRLGFEARADAGGETVTVRGRGGEIPASGAELFLGNSGTSIRFLTALCALGRGTFRLDGVERMRQRPQQDLLDALADWGVSAISENGDGCPPLVVEGRGGLRGGTAHVGAEASSQFLTALLMVAPYAEKEATLQIRGILRPFYVDITRRMMAQFGVRVSTGNNAEFRVAKGQTYMAQADYPIEPDASSASYFFAAAALTGGRVTVPGLGPDALQGDVRFATEVLAAMGCDVSHDAGGLTVKGPQDGKLRGIDRNMSAISDTALTLAAIAPFADSPTTVRHIAHSRLQECDRIAAVCAELRELGVTVEEHPDGYTIHPAADFTPAVIETYHDHRVAMSFALVGLRVPGVVIENPACVAKTFPDYWQRLDLLRSAE